MDRRSPTGWKQILDNKVAAPLLVVAILASLAWLSGVATLPAAVQGQGVRIGSVEDKVEVLERNEIRRDERQQQVLDILKELKDDVKQLRRRER